ncbi:MAG TPA: universal stress protein [Solirubrobacteraceae bacterium]|nr:universal stress protein [Solirubrobacteraceae bacterium]
MFENVVVGIDGSANGQDAIALAAALRAPGGKLTLAHVYTGELRPSTAITPGLAREEQDAAEQLLADARREAGAKDAEVVAVMAYSPGRGLHELAERENADLLVVGSCGRGRFGRVFVGDDARAAMNGAPCAVAIAARSYAQRQAPLARIGVGYDGSSESEAALGIARALASGAGTHARVLETVPIPVYPAIGMGPPTQQLTDELVEDAGKRLRALAGVESRAVSGVPGEELAAFSGELDLLVVGSRAYGPVRRLIVGSTSNYLERHARCSLLVIPRAAED